MSAVDAVASLAVAWPFLGPSPTMIDVRALAAAAARRDAPVLLHGEPGLGKGTAARALHDVGLHAGRQFTAVSAHTSVSLAQALFEPGGAFDSERSGTIVVPEITLLDPHAQQLLLMALDGPARGGRGFIAATSVDLVTEVTEGRFSEALYYRLSTGPVHLPPLRVRQAADTEALSRALLLLLGDEIPRAPRDLSESAAAAIVRYGWPGNIRELRASLERAMILARGRATLEAEDLALDVWGPGAPHLPRTLEAAERLHVERTLLAHDGNRTRAALQLGVSRATLINKIRRFGLAPGRRGRPGSRG